MLLYIIVLLIITVVIHSLWMFSVVKFMHLDDSTPVSAARIVLHNIEIIISMLVIHLTEAFVFSAFYYYVNAINDWATSFYFSLVSYATIGYGDVTLPQGWRLLGAVEGIIGQLMVGWSVAVLVAVLQRIKQHKS